MDKLELYKYFITKCTNNVNSIKNYTDFKRINECISELGYQNLNLLDFSNPEYLEKVYSELLEQEKFVNYDNKGKKKYSNTIQTYLHFLYALKLRNSSDTNTEDLSDDLPLQQIYFGAPGTGKSHEIKKNVGTHKTFRITFHPDTDYSSFVGAYKPTSVEVRMRDMAGHVIIEDGKEVKETKIVYEYVKQAFLNAYIEAWKEQENENPQPVFLVIEEINRGNCAQIFGDIFQLLDRNDSGFSDYAIVPDADLSRHVKKDLEKLDIANKEAINTIYEEYEADMIDKVLKGDVLLLPNNLYIWATMNTSDQSLFPIDSAFKRRWDWEYMPIEKGSKELVIEIGSNKYDWWKFISIINSKIDEITGSEDKKLGYWFTKPVGNGTIISCNQFVSKVLFYLWNDVYKDYADDNRSIFRIQDGSSSKKVAFSDFFGSERDTKLHAFMKANGIEPETSIVENTDVDTAEQQ